jgi:hypothetical protein
MRLVATLHRILGLAVVLALVFAGARPAAADDVLVLKDGRKIPVTRMARKNGQVLFQTTKGESFSVPEDQVASPPLDSIPQAGPPPSGQVQNQLLVLKDGRKIPVVQLARRGGQVLFQTTKGEAFSVTEDQVVSPAVESIPRLPETGASTAPPPTPETPAATAEVPPAPTPTASAAPATPAVDLDFVRYTDRWSIPFPADPRIAKGHLIDPYNQNILKGDKPVIGDRTFLVLTGEVEAPGELRRLPIGSGVSTANPDELEFFGDGQQYFTSPHASLSAELFHGQTAFRPKSWAIKAMGAVDLSYLLLRENNGVDVDVREGKSRRRQDASLEEAFVEAKLADLSSNFDFLSVRAGIQPFVSDFRGFVFSEDQLGARLFGNASNNRWQYNAAYFDLLERETNSDLLTFDKRDQKVFIANVFRQDVFAHGFQVSASYHFSKDDPTLHFDENGFLVRPAKIGSVRPHEVRSQYAGIAGDGHLGRLNLSAAFFQAFGTDDDNPLEGQKIDINAQLAAAELSLDKDWIRWKLTGFYASGDDDPRDGKGNGFDSIYDNSNFAGGPFSFWSRSGIPLTQTGVLLKTPGSLLPDLRSAKFEGQGSFVNPGLMLVGLSADLQLTPKLKAVLNANYLRFDKTGSLDLLLFQPNIRKNIGLDLGGGFLYRPLLNENVVITAGVTGLLPGGGFDDIYSSVCGAPGCGAESRSLMNVFVNLKLTY